MSETAAFRPQPSARAPKPEWARSLPDATESGDPIVYGPRALAPRIEQVEPLEEYALLVTFSTGEVRRVDCRHLLETGVFRELREEAAFRRVQPIHGGGGIGWSSGADLSRDTAYRIGEPV